MKISELIEQLEDMQDTQGDLDVGVLLSKTDMSPEFVSEIEIITQPVLVRDGAIECCLIKKVPIGRQTWVH